jgi:hypothetical protein
MQILFRAVALAAWTAAIAAAQTVPPGNTIRVKFTVDGEPGNCDVPQIEMRYADKMIVPERTATGFVIPAELRGPAAIPKEGDAVQVDVRCGSRELNLSVPVGWVTSGNWTFGIGYPAYATRRYFFNLTESRGMWIESLISECDGCDPGVVQMQTHFDIPQDEVPRLRRRQPHATGIQGRDIAYSLAVFGVDYPKNRDRLLKMMRSCEAHPLRDDDRCDWDLFNYVSNLYWRGHEELLRPLLETPPDVFDSGQSYAYLLDLRFPRLLEAMAALPSSARDAICRQAALDLTTDDERQERVTASLKAAPGEIAARCLAIANDAVRR